MATEPEVPQWELANATPVKPVIVGRARVSFDRPLPAYLIRQLSPEFTLVTVTRPGDWTNLQRRLGLQELPTGADLGRGMIVGILADVGDSAEQQWPIKLLHVRTQSGDGIVEAKFASGLYYPLQTAGYLELAYIPGLRTVRKVRINQRVFPIRSATGVH